MQVIRQRMLDTRVPVKAELGSTWVRIQDVLALQRGDVIKLNRGIDDMAKVRIGSQVKFLGDIGVSRNKMAIKIVKVVKDGDEDD